VWNTAWAGPSLLNLPHLCKVSYFHFLFLFTFYLRHQHFRRNSHLYRHLTNLWQGFDEVKIKVGQSTDNLLTSVWINQVTTCHLITSSEKQTNIEPSIIWWMADDPSTAVYRSQLSWNEALQWTQFTTP
jgi:hypothetical protein